MALGLWWLFGPVSGTGLLLFAVVAVAPLLESQPRVAAIFGAAAAVIALEGVLHVVAGRVSLALFHPPDPIPDGEFVASLVIQAVLLAGVGALMLRIAGSLRDGRAALAADLSRQRELHRLKDEFLATVSHQLRTPLTGLRGFAGLLLDDELGPSEREEFQGLIVSQVEEMHTLIEDVITFNRIETGEFTIRPVPVRARDVIISTVAAMGVRAEGVRCDVDEGIMVVVDPPRLEQMVRNLVDNAIQYGAEPIQVRAVADGGWVRFRVTDGGPGIARDRADTVFEPYTRLVPNSTMSEPGLGLPVVRELAIRHGGSVSYEPEIGGFELRLPLPASPTLSVLPGRRAG